MNRDDQAPVADQQRAARRLFHQPDAPRHWLVTQPHLATHATHGDALPLSAQDELLKRFDIHIKSPKSRNDDGDDDDDGDDHGDGGGDDGGDRDGDGDGDSDGDGDGDGDRDADGDGDGDGGGDGVIVIIFSLLILFQ